MRRSMKDQHVRAEASGNNKKTVGLIPLMTLGLVVSLLFINGFIITGQAATDKAYPFYDDSVLQETPENEYGGLTVSKDIIANMQFSDIEGHWSAEAIIRAGAFNLVKGYNSQFNPEGLVSNEEAIAFTIRLLDMEAEALEAAEKEKATNPELGLLDLWALGYLSVARDLNLITPEEYWEAIGATTPENATFIRTAPATRENMAKWLYRALERINPEALGNVTPIQGAITYRDWENISIDALPGVEAMISRQIMQGAEGLFRPQSGLKRSEMAQIFKNMDSIFLDSQTLVKETGTVAKIVDNQYDTTGKRFFWRNIYIRNSRGGVDVLRYELADSSTPQGKNKDAVVYKGGKAQGLGSIAMGDRIEYIVSGEAESTKDVEEIPTKPLPINHFVYYVEAMASVEKSVVGRLYSIDIESSSIHIIDAGDKHFLYSYREGLLRTDDNTIEIGDKYEKIDSLPYGSNIKLNLMNDMVMSIEFIGEDVLIEELRGIVTENDRDFAVLSLVDNQGIVRHFNYYENDLMVYKRAYYQGDDDIGYASEIYGNFAYDPRITTIDNIEAGDIVFIRPFADDPTVIERISAATNYILRYGKVKQINGEGELTAVMIEYEDKQTSWFDAASDIFVSRDGKPAHLNQVQVGDWVKMLINEAVIEPGFVMESVKEITIEGADHFISTIIKGELNSVNAIQNAMYIEHVETLSSTGWVEYREMDQFDLSNRQIEYFDNGKEVSKDYILKQYKRGGASVYLALEDSYTGEKVAKLSVRTQRDEYYPADYIISADGVDTFFTLSAFSEIKTDAGTIVRRHGRLVDGAAILPQDYASVVLNGAGQAAIVDVIEEPGFAGVSIARGRLKQASNKEMQLESMSTLYGMKWVYSPIERLYTIDHTTRFFDTSGLITREEFIAQGQLKPSEKIYYIVADGSRAQFIYDLPHATKGVRGKIASISGGQIKLEDGSVYNNQTGQFKPVSATFSVIETTVDFSVIIIKNNQVITANELVVGDQLRILTDVLPVTPTSGMSIKSIIILVEK